MRVLLVNGSSRENGCTAAALNEVVKSLNAEGIETETIFIGNKPIADCLACMKCHGAGKCAIDDIVNEFIEKAKSADGFIFGSPVYYSHPSGRIQSFLDRAFFAGGAAFRFKPGAGVLSARRAGNVSALDVLNKYFTICSMPVVSSTYWNHVFGNTPEEVMRDKEGIATMINIGKNMAWLLKCIDIAKKNGLPLPVSERAMTNFIR